MVSNRQTTLRAPVTLEGRGVHSGSPVLLTLRPASADKGIVFIRKGLENGTQRVIRARHDAVSATELCTIIGDVQTGAVSTIEHLMSALYGLGVDNVLVEVDGMETPIMDGSAHEFVKAIEEVGISLLGESRRYIKVVRPVRVENGASFCEFRPFNDGFRLDVEIDFETPVIGRQRRVFDLDPQAYVTEISRARTFGFMRDVEMLWKMGFALGASLDNTVAIGDDKVVNADGLRYPDEFVRHKILDAIGDLALAGLPIIGEFRSYRGGHKMNYSALRALFSDTENYMVVEAESVSEASPAVQMAASASMQAAAFAPKRD
ncbi:MAG: UDP-3-O-acyl-N-acetylglucosamine deacetylase [Bosea sp. (in: a-proteobacteria)]